MNTNDFATGNKKIASSAELILAPPMQLCKNVQDVLMQCESSLKTRFLRNYEDFFVFFILGILFTLRTL